MIEQHQPEQHYVEEVGLTFEHAGLPRMAGRILGWLLICDPPHQSSSDLAEVLQASKGSISTMTQMLLHMGLIERLSLPGQRRDYFRIKPDSWHAIMRRRLVMVTTLRELAERGLSLIDEQSPANRQRLEEMRDLYAFFEREMPMLFERWEQERMVRDGAAEHNP